MSIKDKAQKIFSLADIQINGNRPWDIKINNNKFYNRVLSQGSLGLGESYMAGWWDCQELDEFFNKLLRADLGKHIKPSANLILTYLKARALNLQNKSRAFEIGKKHYDVGNDLYQAMLDERLTYTCGYWNQGAENLNQAQEAKLDLVCRKIGLKQGQKVLDIGCGWGSFAKFAAEKYGAEVVGVTVSKEQVKLGNKICEGLPVEIRLQDYRDVNEKFDHIISLGMFEHVGKKNYKVYMDMVKKNLKPEGLFLLHTIGSNDSKKGVDPWIVKYIFPNSILPSVADIAKATEKKFVMEDWHNFGYNYYYTLKAWMENVDNSWENLQNSYDQKFYRMWRYYLLSCAGAFKSRNLQLWQVVLSPKGVKGGYKSIR